MITTEQWRITIGNFQHHGFKLPNIQSHGNSLTGLFKLIFALLLFVMFLLCDSNISILIIMMKLMIAGDVESNPGPTYNIVKSVKASFHQGNPMFGLTAGIQCACNALFAICWSRIKNCVTGIHVI